MDGLRAAIKASTCFIRQRTIISNAGRSIITVSFSTKLLGSMHCPDIRPVAQGDADGIATIYNHYILNTCVTFEEHAVSRDDIVERMLSIQTSGLPWLVAEDAGGVLGYAYATRWRVRSAYRYSVETSIYLAPAATAKGIGLRLYQVLIEALREKDIHVVIGGITLPNEQSVALHEKIGFQKVAHFQEVGFKFDRWIDVGYWQLLL